MRGSVLGATLFCAAVAMGAAANQTEDLTVEEAFEMGLEELMTVSIATGTPRRLAEAPAIATVITADDIRASGATDLDQVLESVPGLHVSRSHLSNQPLYVMRGLYSETSPYVLFLVNGIPITLYLSGNTGEFWGGMPVESISRVEVIRGPGSAVFGADAVSGVVNIVTRTAEEIDGTELGVRAGSFDTREAWLLHGGRHGGVDVALALQLGTADGHREIVEADAQSSFDAIFGTRASLAPGPVSNGRDRIDVDLDLAHGSWRLRLGLQDRADVQSGAGLTQSLDPTSESDRTRTTADLTWRRDQLSEHWDVEVRASFLEDKIKNRAVTTPSGAFNGVDFFPEGIRVAFRLDERHWLLQGAATFDGLKNHRIRVGAGFLEAEIKNIEDRRNGDVNGARLPGGFQDVSDNPNLVFGLPQDRSDGFFFAQDEWRITRGWDLTLGVRWDEYSDFGGTINPRLALVWQASDKTLAKLLYGRAFRPPSYREQFLINNPELLGNPGLEPEVIDTVELAISHAPRPGLRLGVNLFAYELDDVVLPAGPRPSLYRNIGERTGQGIEIEGEWKPQERLRLLGNFAYQESDDEATGGEVGHAPEQQLYLRADWRLRKVWSVGAVLNAVADRPRVAGDPRPQIDDFATVDLVLRREKWLGHLDVSVSVFNVFDDDVREPSLFVPGPIGRYIADDLPQAGRAVFAELRYRL